MNVNVVANKCQSISFNMFKNKMDKASIIFINNLVYDMKMQNSYRKFQQDTALPLPFDLQSSSTLFDPHSKIWHPSSFSAK